MGKQQRNTPEDRRQKEDRERQEGRAPGTRVERPEDETQPVRQPQPQPPADGSSSTA